MKSCSITLGTPILSSLEGISWFRTDHELANAQNNRGNAGKPVSLLHTANSIVGEISDYPIYFLCSRPRLSLRRTLKTDGTKHEFVSDPTSASPFMHFSLGYDIPTFRDHKSPLPEWCTLNVVSELSDLLKKATGSDSRVIRCEVPKDHQYPNAVSFVFEDDRQAAFYFSPDLWPYMRFELGGPTEANRFGPLKQTIEQSPFNFQVHYIGQSKQVDARLDAHEKIRALSNHLNRDLLHEEPVIFVFKIEQHDVPILDDPKLHVDLAEACLIASFQSHLNIDLKNLMSGMRPKEINLRKRIKQAGISKVTIDLPTPHKYVKFELDLPVKEPLWVATSMAVGEYYSVSNGQRKFWKDMQPWDFCEILET